MSLRSNNLNAQSTFQPQSPQLQHQNFIPTPQFQQQQQQLLQQLQQQHKFQQQQQQLSKSPPSQLQLQQHQHPHQQQQQQQHQHIITNNSRSNNLATLVAAINNENCYQLSAATTAATAPPNAITHNSQGNVNTINSPPSYAATVAANGNSLADTHNKPPTFQFINHYQAQELAAPNTVAEKEDADDLEQQQQQLCVVAKMQKSVTITVTPQRSNSLDYLNFEEKRQLIASSLSLSDILHCNPTAAAAVAAKEVAANAN
ncbi:signal transducer and activator of transcription C-like, partial [Teleopsis dalmanni]|uniref:signal transducer and activator of transcription C-like n=1 Tax=Teleopsis dalmanni TaxID=139649 RepID=UPI0018CF4BF1